MVIGIALRGIGKALLKKGKKSDNAAKRFKARREVLRGASEKQKVKSDVKKLVKDIKAADERITKFSKDIKKKYGG